LLDRRIAKRQECQDHQRNLTRALAFLAASHFAVKTEASRI
jgi:hypothetical protein